MNAGAEAFSLGFVADFFIDPRIADNWLLLQPLAQLVTDSPDAAN
jgi:hypothetical protein